MACVLPLAQPVEYDGEAEMHVGRGRVDAELHAEGPAERELPRELAFGQHVDGVARGRESFHPRESSNTVTR